MICYTTTKHACRLVSCSCLARGLWSLYSWQALLEARMHLLFPPSWNIMLNTTQDGFFSSVCLKNRPALKTVLSILCWGIRKCIVNIAIACSIYNIRIVAKNIPMYQYTGVSLQAYQPPIIKPCMNTPAHRCAHLWCDTHCFTLWCSKFISPLVFTEITTSSPTRKSSRKGSYVSTTLLFWNFICTLSSSWVSFWRLEQKEKTQSEQCSLLYYNYYHDHYLFVWHGPYANMVIAN